MQHPNLKTDQSLLELLAKAKDYVTPEEIEAQRQSWVRGEMGLGLDDHRQTELTKPKRMTTIDRLMRENGGNVMAALEHACRTIEYLSSHVSVGKMRAGPRTDKAAMAYVEGLDIDASQAPHG